MSTITKVKNTDTEQEDLLNLSFKELQAHSRRNGKKHFTMQIEVISKTVNTVLNKHGEPYTEIAVDYVTIPRGIRITKKTGELKLIPSRFRNHNK